MPPLGLHAPMTDEICSVTDAAAEAPFPSPANPDPRNASPFVAAARAADTRGVSFGAGVRHEGVAWRQTSAAVLPPEASAPSSGMRRVSDGIVGGYAQSAAAVDPDIYQGQELRAGPDRI